MTDSVALLLNLLELSESGSADFDLEVTPVFYLPDDFVARRGVLVDGTKVCEVMLRDLKDEPLIDVEVLRKYLRPSSFEMATRMCY